MLLLHRILGLGVIACTALSASAYEIHNASDLITFSTLVATGTYFDGETVRLVNDIEFDAALSSLFSPIGTDYNNFRGNFDGQGHVIRGLDIVSTRKNVGLFGYAEKGAVIRNVILDSSCTLQSNYSQDTTKAFVGGMIGYCFDGSTRKCTVENTVNLATIGFVGTLNNYLYMGPIVGECRAETHGCTIRNNANYGTLVHSGTSKCTEAGGIIGYCYVPSDIALVKCKLLNNLNAGTIRHEGTTTLTLEVGGIVGMHYGIVEDCVFAGTIESNQEKNFYGGLVGYLDDTSYVANSYWSAESGLELYALKYGFPVIENCAKFDSAFEFEEEVAVGTSYAGKSLLAAVNAYADMWSLYDYSRWLLNRNRASVTFAVNSNALFALSTPVILLPSTLDDEATWFDGWYTDAALSAPLTDYEIASSTALYGYYGRNTHSYTITFDTRGGTPVEPLVAGFYSFVQLPAAGFARQDYTFIRWENDYGDAMPWNFTMPAHNMTLHAVWLPTYVRTPEMLIEVAAKVRAFESYEGLTVYLGADLDFSNASDAFYPIGTPSNWFNGTFDGQGHTVSNLRVKSTIWFFGIFGYSGSGAVIRNVVLDDTCSFECSARVTALTDRYVGAIIGSCESGVTTAAAAAAPCVVENSVSAASVAFTGNITGTFYKFLYMGGIIGSCLGDCTIRNNANYGVITQSGTVGASRIGGIAGYCRGKTTRCLVSNNINYGPIVHSGNSTYINVGGVVSYTWGSCFVESCVSAGKIIVKEGNFTTEAIGAVVGSSYDSTEIKWCYWDERLGLEPVASASTGTNVSEMGSFDSTDFALGSAVTVKGRTVGTLLDALNTYAGAEGLPTWVLNKNSYVARFIVNARVLVTFDSKIILLPDLASGDEKPQFDGWYLDSEYTVPLTATEITQDTTLYSLFKEL